MVGYKKSCLLHSFMRVIEVAGRVVLMHSLSVARIWSGYQNEKYEVIKIVSWIVWAAYVFNMSFCLIVKTKKSNRSIIPYKFWKGLL